MVSGESGGGAVKVVSGVRAAALLTSSLSLRMPLMSCGVSCRMADAAIEDGISNTTVFRPIEQMSRCSSVPERTLLRGGEEACSVRQGQAVRTCCERASARKNASTRAFSLARFT